MKLLRKLLSSDSCQHKEKARFVLLFQGRTGSTYVTDRVNAHPKVKMEPEVWGGWGFLISQDEIHEHKQKQSEWLNQLYLGVQNSDQWATGFKTKIDDVLDKRHFMSFIRKHNIRIIFLTRRNTIKLVVSEINAQRLFDKSSTWNLESENDRLNAFRLDLDKFHEQLMWREKVEKWLASYITVLSQPTLTLFYEDMLIDNQGFFTQLYDFLNVPYMDTVGKTFKNTSNDLREVISNYDELLVRYKYTIYEPMILDV